MKDALNALGIENFITTDDLIEQIKEVVLQQEENKHDQ